MMRKVHLCLFFLLMAVAPSANAGTKEELQRLQADVLALQNQIRLLEKAFAEQTQSLKSLVVQLNDQVGKTTLLLEKVSTTLEERFSGDRSTGLTLVAEVQTLSRKMDDTGIQLSALAQQLADMKVQTKPLTQRIYQTAPASPEALAFSADAIFNEAFNDLVQGNFDFAIEGFNAFLRNFPSSEKADDAQYNIGEAYYGARKYSNAISAFTSVVTEYPDGDKVPSAYFKRARAQLALGENDGAIEDLKKVVSQYSDAPEASLAESELTSLGVPIPKPTRRSSAGRKPK